MKSSFGIRKQKRVGMALGGSENGGLDVQGHIYDLPIKVIIKLGGF